MGSKMYCTFAAETAAAIIPALEGTEPAAVTHPLPGAKDRDRKLMQVGLGLSHKTPRVRLGSTLLV